LAFVASTQAPLAQQPSAHELAVQTQEPFWHSNPSAQGGLHRAGPPDV
jgi:hypothetical protein